MNSEHSAGASSETPAASVGNDAAAPDQIRPATPLPWVNDPTNDSGDEWIGRASADYYVAICTDEGVGGRRSVKKREQDARYIVHACNAYHKLVAELKAVEPQLIGGKRLHLLQLLRSLGELE